MAYYFDYYFWCEFYANTYHEVGDGEEFPRFSTMRGIYVPYDVDAIDAYLQAVVQPEEDKDEEYQTWLLHHHHKMK